MVTPLSRLLRQYVRWKYWIFAADLVVLLALLYGSRWFGTNVRDAIIPIVAVGAAAILMESIATLQVKAEAIAVHNDVYENDVAQFAPEVVALVRASLNKDLAFIGYTGGLTFIELLLNLLETEPQLRLRAILVDPDSTHSTEYPEHWNAEVLLSLKRIQDHVQVTQQIELGVYSHTPSITGVMVDERHLFLAISDWDSGTGRIRDGKLTHTYYSRSQHTEHLFRMFESWFVAPGRSIFVSPG